MTTYEYLQARIFSFLKHTKLGVGFLYCKWISWAYHAIAMVSMVFKVYLFYAIRRHTKRAWEGLFLTYHAGYRLSAREQAKVNERARKNQCHCKSKRAQNKGRSFAFGRAPKPLHQRKWLILIWPAEPPVYCLQKSAFSSTVSIVIDAVLVVSLSFIIVIWDTIIIII